jgi:hypothetical protein
MTDQPQKDYWTTAEVMKGIFETKVCLAKHYSSDA